MRFLPDKISTHHEVLVVSLKFSLYGIASSVLIAALGTYFTGGVNYELLSYALAIPTLVAPPACYLLASSIYEMTMLRDENQRIAHTDELTGIANRRSFFERAPKLIATAKAQGDVVSVIIIDIDFFKNINDTYGHKAGDATLIRIADILIDALNGQNAVIGRIGGEEFALLAISKDHEESVTLAERIRRRIKEAFIQSRNMNFSTTASLGLAPLAANDDLDEALHRADRALYAAKNAGRDQMVVFDEAATE